MPSPGEISVFVNGCRVAVAEGCTVGAALVNAGVPQRISVRGEPRAALCGMGICFECRAVVDGVMHRRTCQLVCREGMTVETQP
jgi:sarcosine oxidase subunit alpha